MDRAFAAHRRALTEGLGAIESSIPILWFGDSAGYHESAVRVITVAKNPSSGEFPATSRFLRFPLAAANPSCPVHARRSFDEYFRRAPYWNWFRRLEPLLEGFGASQTGRLRNVSLHLDLYTPVATHPTWGKLPSAVKTNLMADGVPIWNDLVRFLRPEILLLAAGSDQQSLVDGTWTEGPWAIPDWSGNKAVSWGRVRFGPECEPLVVFGVNIRGSPFGALSNHEKVRVAALVGRGAETRTCLPTPPLALPSAPKNTPPSSSWRTPGAVPAGHELHDSLHDLAEQLRHWLATNEGVVENVRLDAVSGDGRGGGKPWIGWKADEFHSEDYSDGVLDGSAFNRVFCLAGDTRRSAVQAFLDLYDAHAGDALAVFECAKSQPRGGASGSLKLKLRTRPLVKYWQCLGNDQRETQLRAKVRRR
jgi:hypothetical protein